MENYYEILGVVPDASKAEIERAYKRLSKAYHPDAGATNDHMFKKIHDIYKVLMDNQARAEYDRQYTSDAMEEAAAEEREARRRTTAAKARYDEAAGMGTGTRRAAPKAAPDDWSTPKKPDNPDTFTMLKQADEYLEKGSWKRADDLYAEVLKIKPKEAKAWIGRLLASQHVKEKAELAEVPRSFEKNEFYLGAVKNAGKMAREELEGYMETAKNRILSEKYDAAIAKMKACDSPKSWQQVSAMFKALGEFKDAETLARRCKGKAEGVKSDDIYKRAKDLMDQGDAESLVEAVNIFQKVQGWKDAEEQIQECYRLLADLKAKEADKPYRAALDAMKAAETMQDYNHAAVLFEALGDYRDAKRKAVACRRNAESSRLDVLYKKALENMTGDRISTYEDSIAMFKELDGWKDSEAQIQRCQKMILEIKRDRYAKATELYTGAAGVQDLLQAATLFSGLTGYRDSKRQSENCKNEAAYVSGMAKFNEICFETEDHPERRGKVFFMDQLSECSDALELFSEIPGWKDADEKAALCEKRIGELKQLLLTIPDEEEKKRKIPALILLIVGVAVVVSAGILIMLKVAGKL